MLDDDGVACRLTDQSEHLSMSLFAKDDNLTRPHLILLLDALLQLEHHRTRGINDLDIIQTGQLIGLRGLAMSTQQYFHVVQLAHLVVIDGDESHVAQALTLHTIMHYITQAIELIALGQLFLGFLDSGSHTEAETTAVVNLNL